MRIGILFSGGKDSTFTLAYYLEQAWDVACLISLIPKNTESWMFQAPDLAITKLQAKALGFPLITQETQGEKEEELLDLKKALQRAKKEYKLDGVAVGALASDYQQERVNRICHELDLKCYAPLWHKNQGMLLKDLIQSGFDIRMVSIAAEGLDKNWLGKKLTLDDYEKLTERHKEIGLHIGGEGGEYETLVFDGPIFKERIEVVKSHVEMENECIGKLVIEKAKLLGKKRSFS
ncbi:MAG TPA: diphthine--ammonia ligase [Candidatus Nanoarchaeia archaeon]|nr:diphthine--ammonia ligase [Candidatus Nanoarchaeia archaeon]